MTILDNGRPFDFKESGQKVKKMDCFMLNHVYK